MQPQWFIIRGVAKQRFFNRSTIAPRASLSNRGLNPAKMSITFRIHRARLSSRAKFLSGRRGLVTCRTVDCRRRDTPNCAVWNEARAGAAILQNGRARRLEAGESVVVQFQGLAAQTRESCGEKFLRKDGTVTSVTCCKGAWHMITIPPRGQNGCRSQIQPHHRITARRDA